MDTVTVEIDSIEMTNDAGFRIDSLRVTCSRCNHRVDVLGTTDASIRRGCATLRDECPEGEQNYYTWDDDL